MGVLAGIARRGTTRAPMEELDAVEITVERGVADDFRGRPGKRQVTLISAEVWNEVCAELGKELPWTTRRANLLVRGVELPRAPGYVIEIGPVSLEVTLETAPCSRMEEQCAGLKRALSPDWRGGVCCRVLTGGRLAVGDEVTVCRASRD